MQIAHRRLNLCLLLTFCIFFIASPARAQFIDAKQIGGILDVTNSYINISKFIVLDNGSMFMTCGGALYGSIDRGAHWKAITDGPSTQFFLGPDNTFYVAFSGGLFSSIDDGASWSNLNDELPNGPYYSIGATNEALFVGCSTGLFRSFDQGETWDHIATKELPAGYSYTPYVTITATGTVMMRNGNTYFRSIDGGETWTKSVPLTIDIWPVSPTRILRYGNTGLERSTDDGISWQTITNPVFNTSYSLAVDRNAVIYTFSGWQLYRSFDTATTWSLVGTISGGEEALAVADDNTLFFTGHEIGLWRTLKPLSAVDDTKLPSLTSLTAYENDEGNAEYTLDHSGNVTLSIYDLRGVLHSTIINGYQTAGKHKAILPDENATGTYLLVLRTDREEKVVKLILP